MNLVALYVICGTSVLLVAILAALIRSIARYALAKAEPQDVPEVVDSMSRLVAGFRPFVPYGRGTDLTLGGPEKDPATTLAATSASGANQEAA